MFKFLLTRYRNVADVIRNLQAVDHFAKYGVTGLKIRWVQIGIVVEINIKLGAGAVGVGVACHGNGAAKIF